MWVDDFERIVFGIQKIYYLKLPTFSYIYTAKVLQIYEWNKWVLLVVRIWPQLSTRDDNVNYYRQIVEYFIKTIMFYWIISKRLYDKF